MTDTIDYIFLSHRHHCLPDHRPVTVLDQAGELAGPQHPKSLLHLREDKLDGVVFGAVGHVEDEAEAQPRRLHLRLLAPVGRQIVEEQGDLLFPILLPQLLQILLELLHVHGLVEDLEVLLALLRRDRRQHGQRGLVQMHQIGCHVLRLQVVFGLGHGGPGETYFVDVDDPISVVPGPRQEPLHRDVLLLFLGGIRMMRLLEPLQGLPLDLVHGIYSSQQRPIDVRRRKLLVEVQASIEQAHACLLPQGPAINEPVDLMLLQEPEAPSLSWMQLLLADELLQEGQLLLLNLERFYLGISQT